ncbi:MAG: hypothetical protein KCHDKBKB_02380 [Elusimicrobia bacterium]|nr:hypothetical protein [Elusimicrobiota bacterium]
MMLQIVFAFASQHCGASNSNNNQNPLRISIALPSEALEFDDLDVRDQWNRPINTAKEKTAFSALWSENLNKKILFSLTPVRLKLMSLLQATWDMFAAQIGYRGAFIWRSIKFFFHNEKIRVNFVPFIASSAVSPPVYHLSFDSSGNPFSFFLHAVISSTRLLC